MTNSPTDAALVIQRLGGNKKTAVLCKVTRSAVSQWRTNGIPRTQLMYLQAVRPDVFSDEVRRGG
jgi:DNA-binding transcriptional regulator YdaS (Cro superfamily)